MYAWWKRNYLQVCGVFMQMWPRYIYTYISRPSATFDASRRLFISSVKFIAVKFSALSSLRPGLYAEPINGNGRCSVDRGEGEGGARRSVRGKYYRGSGLISENLPQVRGFARRNYSLSFD